MLKKINRIHLNKEFDRVFNGQSFYGKSLGIKLAKNDLTITRFGIIVSAKVSKKAVARNRVKRQLREIVQQELPKLKNGYDAAFIVFKPILDKNFAEIKKLVEHDFKKLNLYK